MNLEALAVALLAMVACTAAGPASSSAKERWIVTGDIKLDKINGEPPEKPKSEHRTMSICQPPMRIEALAEATATDLGDGCKAYQVQVKGGKVSFTAICPLNDEGVTYDFDADGTYDAQSVRLVTHGRAVVDGDQMLASGTIIATRAGSCR